MSEELLSAWPNFAGREEFGSEGLPLLVWGCCAGCFLPGSNRKLMFEFIWGHGEGFSFHCGSFWRGGESLGLSSESPFCNLACVLAPYTAVLSVLAELGFFCSCQENIYFLGLQWAEAEILSQKWLNESCEQMKQSPAGFFSASSGSVLHSRLNWAGSWPIKMLRCSWRFWMSVHRYWNALKCLCFAWKFCECL